MYGQKTGFLDWGFLNGAARHFAQDYHLAAATNIDRKIVVCVCECRVAPVNVDVYVRCGVLAAMVTLEVKT